MPEEYDLNLQPTATVNVENRKAAKEAGARAFEEGSAPEFMAVSGGKQNKYKPGWTKAFNRGYTARKENDYLYTPDEVYIDRMRHGDTSALPELMHKKSDNTAPYLAAGLFGFPAAVMLGGEAIPLVTGASALSPGVAAALTRASNVVKPAVKAVGEFVEPVLNNPFSRFYFSRPVQGAKAIATAAPMAYNWAVKGEKPSNTDLTQWGIETGLGVGLGGNWGEASKAAYEIPGYVKGLIQTGANLGKEIWNGASKLVPETGIKIKRIFNPEYRNFTDNVINQILDGSYGYWSLQYKKPLISYFESVEGSPIIYKLEGDYTPSSSNLRGFADKVYKSLYNKNFNGIKAKEFSVPKQVIDGYYTMLKENATNPLYLYFKNLEHGRTPFGTYLYNDVLNGHYYWNYATSRPTWKNWVADGSKLSKTRIREYNNIYSSLSDADKELVKSFMEKTGLPMESAIQMMSPEYYNFLKTTKTPILSTQVIKDGVPIQSYKPNLKSDRSLDTKYLHNFDAGFNWINVHSGSASNLSVVPKEINPSIDRFRAQDLDNLVNNVQYIGNRFPYADRIYTRGTPGYISGEGYSTPGAIYGSFRPGHSIGYTISRNWPAGKLHYVTSAGKPLFSNNFHDSYDLKKYLGMDHMFEYSPSSFNKEAFKYLHNKGYDWFVDIGKENQFAVDNPYLVKNLVGNNGDFNIKDINWFHKQGGKLIKRKHI